MKFSLKPLTLACLLLGLNTHVADANNTLSWLSDGKASFDSRNMYWSDNYGQYGGDWVEWAQGFQFIYQARHKEGWGLDLSIYATQKLYTNYSDDSLIHPEQGSGGILSQDHQFGNDYNSGRGYGRMGEAAFGYFTDTGFVRAGYFRRTNSLTLISNFSRATPASYRGYEFEYNVEQFKFYGAWVDQIARRESDTFVEFATAKQPTTGQPFELIDYIWNIGSKYQQNSWSAELDFSQSKNYMNYGRFDITKTFTFANNTNLKLTGQYAQFKRAGKKWDIGGAVQAGFSKNARHSILAGQYHVNNITLNATIAHTQAKNDVLGGYLFYWIAGNEHGFDNFESGAIKSEFKKNGETELATKIAYRFTDYNLPQLSIALAYHHGSGIDLTGGAAANMDFTKEQEAYVEVHYQIQTGLFENGYFMAAIGQYTAYNQINPELETFFIRTIFDFKF
jgi:hypothetical protein